MAVARDYSKTPSLPWSVCDEACKGTWSYSKAQAAVVPWERQNLRLNWENFAAVRFSDEISYTLNRSDGRLRC